MNKQTGNTELDKSDVTLKLYTIKNIAIMAAYCEEKRIDVYHLQNVASHIAEMIDGLIDDIGA